MTQLQNNNTPAFYTLLSLPATAMGFALCVQISALSWILSTKYNLDISQVGYVWLSGPIAGIIGQLLVGITSDKTWLWGGRRRPFIIIGGTIAALMLLCLPNLDKIANTIGINDLMIVALGVALTLDLAINVSFNPTRALIADMTPEGNERTKGYTWMQTISGFFGVAAYLISAFTNNYYLIYIGIALVLLFSIVPTLFINEPRTLSPSNNNHKSGNNNVTQSNELWKIYIAHAFTWLGVQTMFVYIFAYIKQKINLPDDNAIGQTIGYAFAILNTIGFLLPLFVLTPLSKQFGRIKIHSLSLVFMSLAYWGIVTLGTSTAALYFFMLIAGIGWASVVSIPFAILSDKVSQDKMGWYMGIFNLSVVIPQIIVSGLFGNIIEQAANKNIIFIIAGTSLALSAILWSFVKEK